MPCLQCKKTVSKCEIVAVYHVAPWAFRWPRGRAVEHLWGQIKGMAYLTYSTTVLLYFVWYEVCLLAVVCLFRVAIVWHFFSLFCFSFLPQVRPCLQESPYFNSVGVWLSTSQMTFLLTCVTVYKCNFFCENLKSVCHGMCTPFSKNLSFLCRYDLTVG